MAEQPNAGTSSQETKSEVKMIPLNDLLALKQASANREKKLREELRVAQGKITQLESEVNIVKTNTDDDEEVSAVKTYLLKQQKDLNEKLAKYEAEKSEFSERDRKFKAQELATKYGIDVSAIEDEENIEHKALELYADKLAKERDELKTKVATPAVPGQPQIYESLTTGLVRKSPLEMNTKELADYEAQLKAQASKRK